MERTLMMVKPDAVGKNAIGAILQRVESEGFLVRELRMTQLSNEQGQDFYEVHKERPFYDELVQFMTRGPVIPAVLERENAVLHLREVLGVTDSTQAAEGTVRNLYGTDVQENAIHGSDSQENAALETAFFFSRAELLAAE